MSLKIEISKLLNAKMITMKKLRDKIENFVLKTEDRWKILPIDRQRLLTKVFLGGYCLLTVIVLIHIIVSTGQKSNTISIDHIDGITKKPVEKDAGQIDTTEIPIKE